MDELKERLAISMRTKCFIFIYLELTLSIILTILDVCYIVWLRERLNISSQNNEVLSHFLDEPFSENYTEPKTRFEIIEKIFILMSILHLYGILINAFLIYAMLKAEFRYFRVWLMGNALKVVSIGALLFFLVAVYLSLGIKIYQMYAIMTLFLLGGYCYMHVKLMMCINDLYFSVKHEAPSRLKSKRAGSEETVDHRAINTYGTESEMEDRRNVFIEESQMQA